MGGGHLAISHWIVPVTAETPLVLASAVPSIMLVLFSPLRRLKHGDLWRVGCLEFCLLRGAMKPKPLRIWLPPWGTGMEQSGPWCLRNAWTSFSVICQNVLVWWTCHFLHVSSYGTPSPNILINDLSFWKQKARRETSHRYHILSALPQTSFETRKYRICSSLK